MKNKLVLLIVIIALVISACGNLIDFVADNKNLDNERTNSVEDNVEETIESGQDYDKSNDNISPVIEYNVNEIEITDDEGMEDITIIPEDELYSLGTQQMALYAYSLLNAEDRKLYTEILWMLNGRYEEVKISTLDEKKINNIFKFVMMDHPEIFYVEGYSYMVYTVGKEIKSIILTGNYLYSMDEIDNIRNTIEIVINDIISGISSDATEYDKVKYVYEAIINRTKYNLNSPDNQNIISVFINNESVCQGYSKATQLLLQRLGIQATLVNGFAYETQPHSWIIVKVDGKYYYVDPTWGDASFTISEGHADTKMPEITYDYLCVTSSDISKTHKMVSDYKLPECNSLDANYYVMEGAYFDKFDKEQMRALFDKYYAEDREYLTIRCSNLEAYEFIQKSMISGQEIFKYIKGKNGNISYFYSDDMLTISFWL